MKVDDVFTNYRATQSDNAKCVHCEATFYVPVRELHSVPNMTIHCPNCKTVQKAQVAVDNFDRVTDSVV